MVRFKHEIMIKHLLLIFFFISSVGIFAQTTTTGNFMHDGELRTYRLYIPASYDGTQPMPLVFNLHGYGSNNIEQENYGDFRPIADTANFIIVHPQGLPDLIGTNHWNTFGTSSVDDVSFLSQLIDTIYANYNIDGNRIYSTGMSNGGFMSYKLACLLSGRIAAVASVTGSITPTEFADCITNHPMPVMQIHGTEDPTVPYAGSAFFMPVEDVVDHFVNFNDCNPVPITTPVADIDATDGCTATHYVYTDGLLGSTVEFFKIEGGKHTWPGSAFETGVTNQDFNASVEIWRFFSQYRLNILTSSVDEVPSPLNFSIVPNPAVNETVSLVFNTNEQREITVMNALGQIVLSTRSSDAIYELTIETKGLYFVTITENGQTHTEKLIRN